MTQSVGSQVGGIRLGSQMGVNDASHHSLVDPTTTGAEEECPSRGGADPFLTTPQPFVDSAQRGPSHRHGALLVSLAGHSHRLARAVDVTQVQTTQLTDAQAASVEHFQDGGITGTLR